MKKKTYTEIYKNFHGQNRDPFTDFAQLVAIGACIGLFYLMSWVIHALT